MDSIILAGFDLNRYDGKAAVQNTRKNPDMADNMCFTDYFSDFSNISTLTFKMK